MRSSWANWGSAARSVPSVGWSAASPRRRVWGSGGCSSPAAPPARCPGSRWCRRTTSTGWCRRLPRDVGVVVVAAGQGTRLGGGVPKQYRPLAGVPMLLRALGPFRAHPEVAHVVVVLPPADVESPPEWLAGLVGPGLSLAS